MNSASAKTGVLHPISFIPQFSLKISQGSTLQSFAEQPSLQLSQGSIQLGLWQTAAHSAQQPRFSIPRLPTNVDDMLLDRRLENKLAEIGGMQLFLERLRDENNI